ncbi:MAG: Arc family DNA-binding protein [Haliea sp.]
MASLVIKNLPDEVHKKLKRQAARHHRSMTGEAIMILSRGVSVLPSDEVPAPYEGRFPLTDEFIEAAKDEGRE